MLADVHIVFDYDAFVAVPNQIGFEVVDAMALAISVMVELLFDTTEEVFDGRIIGEVALGAHGVNDA